MPPRVDRFIAALQALRDQSAASAPAWTDGNDSDPGITLVELLGFLADQIGARPQNLPAAARTELGRLGLRLSQLAGAGQQTPSAPNPTGTTTPVGGPLQRNRFFSGRLLTAADFELEQRYMREKFRRLQRASLSSGVVSGLGVELSGGGPQPAIVVEPGLAVDPDGELIEVGAAMTCSLPAPSAGQHFVLLRYVERPTAPVPVGNSGSSSPVEASRIEEGFAISVEPQSDAAAVLLARLVPSGQRWKIIIS